MNEVLFKLPSVESLWASYLAILLWHVRTFSQLLKNTNLDNFRPIKFIFTDCMFHVFFSFFSLKQRDRR